MKFILGTKQNMTQVFDENGRVTPVTVVNIPEQLVTEVKSAERDGYTAVQVGAFPQKKERVNKPQREAKAFKTLKEFKVTDSSGFEVGKTFDASVFEAGDVVVVSGTSKAKGFQGVVKRHNFAGGPRTHGNKHQERKPGSIGSGGIQRVFKGLRMAGRMGGDRVTVKNLKIVQVDAVNNQLLIGGAVPGRRGTVLEISTQ